MVERERVLVDMTVGVPAERVWSALREPDLIKRWFGWDYDGLDAEVDQIFVRQVSVDDSGRTLAWPDGDRIQVTEQGDGARLEVLRRGHPGLEEGLQGVHDPVDEGWITFTQQLRFALERHGDAPRRTVSGIGLDLGTEDDPLLSRLGLRSLGDDEVGSRYSVERPDGSTFGGEVFFQTDLQVGLSVEEEDDALLVIARTPPASAPPHGEVMFLLSLYGVDDERAAEAGERWRRWWSG